MEKRKRKFGDRYDVYRIKTGNSDLFFALIPHIMRTRTDSQCFFDEKIDIEPVEELVRELKRQGHTDIRLFHVFMAAMVRVISQYPKVNRFVAGNNIYARNTIVFSIAVKRNMTSEGQETTVKIEFEPTDTLLDVSRKINEAYLNSMNDDNSTDKFVKSVMHMPSFILHWIVSAARNLDKIGLMPKFLYEASPFHSSVFLTDVGSIGISSIYHHLYEFGTTSVFMSMGKKEKRLVVAPDGTVKEKKYINIGVVIDERICDGFYYGVSFKTFSRIMKNPKVLLSPPARVVEDDFK